MENTSNYEFWEKILEKFSSYEGTVSSFCSENNISKGKLYYYKKRLNQSNKPIFHAISLKNAKTSDDAEKAYKDIRIEIGEANIFIPVNETALLKTLLKELAATC